MATDIGICLGRIVKGKPDELWKLQVQIPLLLSFFVGGVVGALAHEVLGKHAMFISVGLFASIGILFIVTLAYTNEESFYEAAFGEDDFPIGFLQSGKYKNNAVEGGQLTVTAEV